MPLSYVVGDATKPAGEGNRVLVHVCNDSGKWGAGFVLAISRRWPQPEAAYKRLFDSSTPPALGDVQFVETGDGVTVANLIGQHGIRRAKQATPPIRYDAIRRGLAQVARFALEHSASVHMPRIGCGLAGGNWEEIEPIVDQELVARGIPVTVYDFQP